MPKKGTGHFGLHAAKLRSSAKLAELFRFSFRLDGAYRLPLHLLPFGFYALHCLT